VAVKDAIELPDPLAPIPIEGLLLLHTNVVPDTLLLNIWVLVLALLQTLWDVGVTVIIGVAFTVTFTTMSDVEVPSLTLTVNASAPL
jgi:hypothetical protein